jgi:predicted nuclease of predicted toxin-antitoxin system
MKLLVDMNLTPDWVQYLSKAGLQAVHWSSVGGNAAPDADIVAYAQAEGYVIFTRDLDFSAILALSHGDKPSVVQLRVQEVLPEDIGETVVWALRQAEKELEAGALLSIDNPARTRLRLLPLGFRQ